MFKKLLFAVVIVCALFAVVSCDSSSVKETAFKVGDVYYKSLQEACDEIIAGTTGSNHIVEVVKDATGPGVSLELGFADYLIVDFNSYTYTLDSSKTTGDADFCISGGIFTVSGEGGKINGSGNTLFLLNKANMVFGQGLSLRATEGTCVADATDSYIFIDAYFDGTLSGGLKLSNGKLYFNSKEGNISIGNLEMSGTASQVVFNVQRTAGDTEIKTAVINDSSEFTFTAGADFDTEMYDSIDSILKNTGCNVHRHVYSEVADKTVLNATCCTNRYDAFGCTVQGCGYVAYREVEGTKYPTKHKLIHVDAVEPTETTSGIIECRQCENCYQYFNLTDIKEAVNPIILATNNVPYDEVRSNLSELGAAMDELDKKKGLVTRGISFDLISSAAGLIGVSVMDFFDDTDEQFSAVTEKLVNIEGQLDTINNNVTALSKQLENKDLGDKVNERVTNLNDFNNATNVSFGTLFRKEGEKYVLIKDEETIKSVVTYWGDQMSCGSSNHTTALNLMTNVYPIAITSADGVKLQDNIFNIYDTLGRNAAGWEKASRSFRKSVRTLDTYTIVRAYLMGRLYAQYSTTLPETLREASEAEYNAALEKYKGWYDKFEVVEDDSKVGCYLSGNYMFSKKMRTADYSGVLEANKDKYKLCVHSNMEETTKSSIDSLISDVGGSYLPLDFYNTVAQWYNKGKNKADQKNIYEILEEQGFTGPEGEKLSECYGKDKFLIADNDLEFDGGNYFEDVITSYRLISFYQKKVLKNSDWVGINSVISNAAEPGLECKKFREDCNFKNTSGEITNVGEPSGNKFFTLEM